MGPSSFAPAIREPSRRRRRDRRAEPPRRGLDRSRHAAAFARGRDGTPDAVAAPARRPQAGPPPATPAVEDAASRDVALLDARVDGAATADAASEAAPEASTSCDQDGDGHLAAGPPCFGDDCCDTDANVHPGQTAYFTSASLCGGYDYDCDGASTPEYGVANCQWVGLGCTGDGFVSAADCGETAPFSVCASTSVVTCAASVGSLTQACR